MRVWLGACPGTRTLGCCGVGADKRARRGSGRCASPRRHLAGVCRYIGTRLHGGQPGDHVRINGDVTGAARGGLHATCMQPGACAPLVDHEPVPAVLHQNGSHRNHSSTGPHPPLASSREGGPVARKAEKTHPQRSKNANTQGRAPAGPRVKTGQVSSNQIKGWSATPNERIGQVGRPCAHCHSSSQCARRVRRGPPMPKHTATPQLYRYDTRTQHPPYSAQQQCGQRHEHSRGPKSAAWRFRGTRKARKDRQPCRRGRWRACHSYSSNRRGRKQQQQQQQQQHHGSVVRVRCQAGRTCAQPLQHSAAAQTPPHGPRRPQTLNPPHPTPSRHQSHQSMQLSSLCPCMHACTPMAGATPQPMD